jgi:hypothetical protein
LKAELWKAGVLGSSLESSESSEKENGVKRQARGRKRQARECKKQSRHCKNDKQKWRKKLWKRVQKIQAGGE